MSHSKPKNDILLKPVSRNVNARPAKLFSVRQQRFRAEIIDVALDIMMKKGFDATTVADIVKVVGVTQRTFYRYFQSKEDIVFDWMDEQGEYVRPLLKKYAAQQPPLLALQKTFCDLARHDDSQQDISKMLIHLIYDTPSLSGRYYLEHGKWRDEWVRLLVRHEESLTLSTFELQIHTDIAISAFVNAIREWAMDAHNAPLVTWVTLAFNAIETTAQQFNINATSKS